MRIPGIKSDFICHPRTGEILSCRLNIGHGFLKGKSLATYYDANSWGWRMTNTLNYTKELNKNNRINATIGVEESLSRSYIMRQTAEGLTSEASAGKYDVGRNQQT